LPTTSFLLAVIRHAVWLYLRFTLWYFADLYTIRYLVQPVDDERTPLVPLCVHLMRSGTSDARPPKEGSAIDRFEPSHSHTNCLGRAFPPASFASPTNTISLVTS